MTTIEARSLHRKLAQVMYEAERIPKNGIGPREQGSYPFVQVGDAADFIRKALAEKVVTMMPTRVTVVGQSDRLTEKGKTMTTVDLIVDWTITDGESGESITIQSFGAGADTGDKYSGKASTSAMKYALLTGFLLSTGDDTEQGTDTAASRPVLGAPVIASDRRPAADPLPGRGGPLEPLPPERDEPAESFETTVEGKMTGGAAPADLQFRQTPNGLIFGFVVEAEGRKRLKVMVEDGLAVALQAAGADTLKGVWVTVEGRIERIPWKKGDRDMPPYEQMTLARIATPEWTLPAPSLTEPFTAEDVAELENTNVEPLWPEGVS